MVRVRISPDLSSTGRVKWKKMPIDSCIASLVRALQAGGINMKASCCGHNRIPGVITLDDGRDLLVTFSLKHFNHSLCLWHFRQSLVYLLHWLRQKTEETQYRILGR